jgi:hypothetical protein
VVFNALQRFVTAVRLANVKRACVALSLLSTCAGALAQTSTITYQGRLTSSGAPYTGSADLRVSIVDAATGGNVIAGPLARSNVTVTDGYVTLNDLDFGSAPWAIGTSRWVRLEVRTPSDPTNTQAYTTLAPNQPVTSTPFAVAAANTLTFGGFAVNSFRDASSLSSGILPTSRLAGLYTNSLSFTNAANTFFGNGANLTSLSAANVSSGTLPDARLSTNIPRLNAANSYTGGQLSIFAPGSTSSGAAGFPEVVFAARNTSAGGHTAISIDALTGQDSALYFAESGVPTWGLRTDNQPNKEFQLRYHDAGANTTVLSVSTAGNVGLGTVPVAANKLSVAGAIATTSGGIVFPDGSRQLTAATGIGQPAATYPAGTNISITFNGAPCSLSGALTLECNYSILGSGSGASPQLSFFKPVIFSVSRIRTSNTDWQTLWSTYTTNIWSGAGSTLVISRTETGSAASATLTLGALFPCGYEVRPDGLGNVREVLKLAQYNVVPSLPVYAGGTLGNGTITQDSGLTPFLSGISLNGVVMADFARSVPVNSTGSGGGGPSNYTPVAPGSLSPITYTLREPFAHNQGLRSWARDTMVAGFTDRRRLSINAGGVSFYSSTISAEPIIYRVVQAADGSLYEEYVIFAAP